MSNPEMREPDEVKKSDEIRRAIEEENPQLKKPFEEWSDKEKTDFVYRTGRHAFNNFVNKCPGGSAEKNLLEVVDLSPKERWKYSEEKIAEEVATGRHSERYFKEPYRQFFDNIREALVKNGVNIEEFAKRNELREALDQNEQFAKDEDERKKFRNECMDVSARITLDFMPAFLDLIDSGYTKYDLAQ